MTAIPSARVVAITKPIIDECQSAGDLVAYCARVSNPGNQANTETAPRLLDYLKRHKHWSPFEMATATVEVETTRDIARQLLRHRSLSFQEFSGRYAEHTEFADRVARRQDADNRQNSFDDMSEDDRVWFGHMQNIVQMEAIGAYQEALERGIAKECARALLPEGLTVSRLYVQGSFRSWLHYLDVREDGSTQKEHRDLAAAIRAALATHEPLIFGEVA